MKTEDFKTAIEALSVNGLEITKYSHGINGQVVAVYGRMGENTFLMWDSNGRGFSIELNYELEGVCEPRYPEYLDYRRDNGFDLDFNLR